MSLVSAAVMASEAAGESAPLPAWAFGLAAFGVLVLLLIITMMINVDR